MDLVNKQAEYYDSYLHDNPSYWEKMRAFTNAKVMLKELTVLIGKTGNMYTRRYTNLYNYTNHSSMYMYVVMNYNVRALGR